MSNSLSLFTWRRMSLFILIMLVIGGGAGTYFFYNKYRSLTINPEQEAQVRSQAMLAELAKLIELPSGEDPTMAVISDKAKLQSQEFFKTAENGDVLFAYTAAGKAILYRPMANKIINVAPISLNQPATPTPAPAASEPKPVEIPIVSLPRVAYYNGSETIGLAVATEKKVREAHPDWPATVGVSNAARKDYVRTMIVDLTGKYTAETEELGKLLGGQVGILPAGEAKPETDILIISGK